MEPTAYCNGVLAVEKVALPDLAERYGTPLYVYSRGALRAGYRSLAAALSAFDPLICYSVKANSNAAVLQTFLAEGAGLDIVSGGELFRGLRAGADPARTVFAGVGKAREEIRYALAQDILFFTVESEREAERISECASRAGKEARIAFRVNPDVDPKTHRYISTGRRENKFGLDLERTRDAYALAARLPNLVIAGLHMHIGSQILSADPYVAALEKIQPLCRTLRRQYASFRYLDIGGGFGIGYEPGQAALDPHELAARIGPLLGDIGLRIVVEPGRSLVGNAGILLCRVEVVKDNAFKKFVVVDAGMNDLLRPALYGAYHEVIPVTPTEGRLRGDLVGPICESGDFLAQDRELPAAREGDLLAVLSAGAYGYTMASNYNSRPRPAEAMVDDGRAFLVRRRETWEDLVAGETEINGAQCPPERNCP